MECSIHREVSSPSLVLFLASRAVCHHRSPAAIGTHASASALPMSSCRSWRRRRQTTRTSTNVAPERRAKRRACGNAPSASSDPSSGTKIVLITVILLSHPTVASHGTGRCGRRPYLYLPLYDGAQPDAYGHSTHLGWAESHIRKSQAVPPCFHGIIEMVRAGRARWPLSRETIVT